MALLTYAGLVFQDWFFKAPYHPVTARPSSNALLEAIAQLSPLRQWAAMERIQSRNACHFLLACKPERAAASYRLDPAGSASEFLVPSLRWRCRLDGGTLITPHLRIQLNEAEQALMLGMDGRRCIGELCGPDGLEAAKAAIQRLWLLDGLDLTLPGATGH